MKRSAVLMIIPGILCLFSLSLYSQEPDDPYYNLQWGLQKIEIEDAWGITSGSSSIKIAVVDTGCDLDHEDLASRIDRAGSKNLINPLLPPEDDSSESHGTHVAGIIAGVVDNGKGIAGVTKNCRLIILKALDANGDGYVSTVAEAISTAALTQGVKVINCSFGGPVASSALREAVNAAVSKGIVVVSAAGNAGTSLKYAPAGYENVIGVTSTDRQDKPCYGFTNYNPPGHTYYEIAAPGRFIYSTRKNNRYGSLSGTSMSAAFVSGVCALLLSQDSSLSPSEVKSILENTADPIVNEDPSKDIGKGRVNAYKALLQVSGTTPPPVEERVNAVAYVIKKGQKSARVSVGEEVQFYGDESTAPQGYRLNYLWTFGDGDSSSQMNPTHTFQTPGKYKVKLLVYTYNALDSDEVEVEVEETSPPPPPSDKVKAIAYVKERGKKSAEVNAGEEVQFFGDQSTAPEGKRLKYLWTFGDGTSSQEVNPIHVYQNSGEYTVRLLVYTYDDLDTDDVKVIVVGEVPPPQQNRVVISGKVKDKDGNPLTGASVVVRGEKREEEGDRVMIALGILGRDTTDSKGNYRIEISLLDNEQITQVKITASKRGYESQHLELGTLNPGDNKIVNFTLKKISPPQDRVRIYGKVTEARTGKPVANARVYVKFRTSPFPWLPWKFRGKLEGDDSKIRIFPFYRNRFLVEVVKVGYSDGRRWITLKPGDERELNFRLWKYNLEVKFSSLKNKFGSRFVTIAETTTDKDGKYDLEFKLPSLPYPPIPPQQEAVIYGQVRDVNGQGLSGATVGAYRSWDNLITIDLSTRDAEIWPPKPILARAITDRNGNYRLVIGYPYPWEPIPLKNTNTSTGNVIIYPGRRHIRLTASKRGYTSQTIEIDIAPGEEKRVNFTLRKVTISIPLSVPNPDPIVIDDPLTGPYIK
jgi:PKD repeat protein